MIIDNVFFFVVVSVVAFDVNAVVVAAFNVAMQLGGFGFKNNFTKYCLILTSVVIAVIVFTITLWLAMFCCC